MRFTPEILLQIYLDGSFTEEAQAEFDALMRRDPAFAERVTEALAQRLGPVPEEVVNSVSARLDGKIGDLWARHKPSRFNRYLKWGAQIALVLAAAGGLFFGGRLLVAKLSPAESEVVPSQDSQALSQMKTAAHKVQKNLSNAAGEKDAVSGNRVEMEGQRQVPLKTQQNSLKNSNGASSDSLNTQGDNGALSPVSASSQKSSSSSSVVGNPEVSFHTSTGSTTAEGNSLRVAIDMDQTEKVDVTVFDANGLLVRHLYSGMVSAGGHYVDWDGKDEQGNVVVPGDYTVIFDRGGKKMSGILKLLPNQ